MEQCCVTEMRNFGVTFDSQINLDSHMNDYRRKILRNTFLDKMPKQENEEEKTNKCT